MYPDFGLFPIIARYFNISIDCLFGFSNELSEEEYFSHKRKCVELFESGMCLAGVEKIRNLCRLYPTDDRLKVDLIKSVLPYAALEEDIEIRNTAIHQMISICQECTDDSFQSQKHFLLAHLFMLIGKYEMIDNSLNSKSDFMAIDMKNSLLLREGDSSTIDKIDSTVIILGIQLVYELRNKASYLMGENNLTNALEIFKMQCTLINLLELDSSLYFIIYMNMAYIHCICGQINEVLKTIQKFIALYKDKPIRDNVLIRVLQTGYILERIKEADSLNVFFSPIFLKFLTSVFSFIGAWVFILSIRWELSLILLFFLPILYYFTNYSSIQIKKASQALLESNAQTSGKIQENIGGISAIKELNIEKQRSNEISKQIKSVADKSVKRSKLMNVASEGIQGFTNLFSAFLIVCSGIFIIKGKMSMGDYWAVSQYAMVVFAPIQILASVSVMVQPGVIALTRINEILKLKTEEEIDGKREMGQITDISFSKVSFGYLCSLAEKSGCSR